MGIDLKQTQLRQQRAILYSLAIGGTLSGFLVWSVAPFVTQNKALRFLSLSYSAIAGLITCYSSSVLIRNQRIYKALDSSEIDDYLHQLAVTQYGQQRYWESQGIYNPVNPEMTNYQTLPEFTNANGKLEKDYLHDLEMLADVSDAIEDGLSDSQIIQNILGYKGRNYNEGKTLLKQIKQLMETEENDKQSDTKERERKHPKD